MTSRPAPDITVEVRFDDKFELNDEFYCTLLVPIEPELKFRVFIILPVPFYEDANKSLEAWVYSDALQEYNAVLSVGTPIRLKYKNRIIADGKISEVNWRMI